MFAAILAFLKKAALKAATVAKAAAKGVVEHPVKTLIDQTPPGQLYNAFKSMATPQQGKPGVADVGGMGNVPTAPADYYKSPQGQITPPNQNMQSAGSAGSVGMGGAGQGILSFLGESGVGENKGQDVSTYQPNRTPIPVNYQQFVRQPGMQYAPQTDSLNSIPEQYRSYAQPTAPVDYFNSPQAQIRPPEPISHGSFLAGAKDFGLGMPNTKGYDSPWYYAGGIIPGMLREKLGLPRATNPADVEEQKARTEYYKSGATVYDENTLKAGDRVPAKGIPIKKDKVTETERFQLRMNQAVEAIKDLHKDPEAVKAQLKKEFGNRLKEIEMMDAYL